MPEENDIGDFQKRFQQLAIEAKGYGIDCIIILGSVDPIAQQEVIVDCGTAFGTRKSGMLQQVVWSVQRDV